MTISAGLDRFANNATTILNGGINSVVTTIVVTSALGFPNPGPYRILIGNEQMQVTGGYGTTSWTVIRGVDGTTPASHSNTDAITNNITAFDYNSLRQEWNVLAYGAVGDGVADDATAFQNVINDAHAQASGGHVYLPDLPFKIGSALTTYSNVVFITHGAVLSGAGSGSVTPLIRFTQLGGLTLPGALTASVGATITTGGLIVSAGQAFIGNNAILKVAANGGLDASAGSQTVNIGTANANVLNLGNSTSLINYNYATTALGGGAAPTFGTIAGSGPATAAQNSWLKVNINGTATYIPVWR